LALDYLGLSHQGFEHDVGLALLVTEIATKDLLGRLELAIEKRITDRLAAEGIDRGKATALAKAIEDETDAGRLARARAEMDDEEKARHERLLKEEKELQQVREDSRIRVGVSADDLRRVVGAAMARAGTSLDKTRGESVGNVTTFNLDPSDPAFAKDAGWQDVTAIWTEAERERKPLRPLGEP
jgi:hypothetical protein